MVLDVLNYLIDHKMTISFAESCTGGAVSAALVKIPKASYCLKESYVTYATEAKERILGVRPETVSKYGVVSPSVAKEMAMGVKKISSSSVGVGITGLAGPDGDGIHSVGTVCFGFQIFDRVFTEMVIFKGSREEVINEAVMFVYSKLREALFNENTEG